MESAAEQQQIPFKDRDGTRVVAAAAATVETLVDAELEQNKSKFVLPEVSLVDRHADEPRRLRVTVIGAGIAGIVAGALLPAKVPGIELTIFEKNADVGGVWFENVYPGVRCDVPAHVYQTSFAPNTQWSEEYAQGPELRDYWAGVARKYDVYKHLKVSHEVKDLHWDNGKSVWLVKVCNLQSGEVLIHEADFVLTAIGRFNDWRLPDYPGINDFKGHIRHTSNWDPTYDVSGKRVAVIGNGASGIQLVPHLQKKVARLDHYARSKTWIAESWGGESTKIERKLISKELRDSFQDTDVYLKYRKNLEQSHWRFFHGWLKDSDSNKEAREALLKHLAVRLAKRPELIESLIPGFSPHCRRLTPGPGYLEAIMEDNVDYIQNPIKRFTETGIETADGTHREVDAVFAATGANVDVLPPFGITANGKSIAQLWSPDGEYGFPYSYLGFATPGFPNLGFIQGPNGAGRSGTVPHNVEVQVTYFAKILRKVGREGIKTMQPSKKAADDFVQYSDAFFKKTVMSECKSWYNTERPGSRIHGLWPGSAALVGLVVNDPRWEDWDYEYLSDTGNSLLGYFGNGCTKFETDPEHDVTNYLVDPADIDLRKLHEGWWNIP
ncbi:4-hydroxyacetophenone monooxygenase [Colletotrichum tabaci]|uniref:4-hydroxyacetophenone monooxygenase n=1 Tax=Colletotrichum tabaci TaxID=1209068 RepID=A0AAV9T909_9PEZI